MSGIEYIADVPQELLDIMAHNLSLSSQKAWALTWKKGTSIMPPMTMDDNNEKFLFALRDAYQGSVGVNNYSLKNLQEQLKELGPLARFTVFMKELEDYNLKKNPLEYISYYAKILRPRLDIHIKMLKFPEVNLQSIKNIIEIYNYMHFICNKVRSRHTIQRTLTSALINTIAQIEQIICKYNVLIREFALLYLRTAIRYKSKEEYLPFLEYALNHLVIDFVYRVELIDLCYDIYRKQKTYIDANGNHRSLGYTPADKYNVPFLNQCIVAAFVQFFIKMHKSKNLKEATNELQKDLNVCIPEYNKWLPKELFPIMREFHIVGIMVETTIIEFDTSKKSLDTIIMNPSNRKTEIVDGALLYQRAINFIRNKEHGKDRRRDRGFKLELTDYVKNMVDLSLLDTVIIDKVVGSKGSIRYVKKIISGSI